MSVDALFWLLVILVLIVVMFFGISMLRRWVRSTDESPAAQTFTLGDLRSMLKRGQITQEEYDRLRNQIISTVKKDADKPATPDNPPDPLRPPEPPEE